MVESNSIPLSQTTLQQAMEWQVTFWSGEVSAQEQIAFERWLRASPLHEQAWQKVQHLSHQLGQVPNPIANRVLRQTAAVDQQRRKLLFGLSSFACLGILGFGVSQTPQWQIAAADYRTGRGERRELILHDGTQLMLNTASAVNVNFNASSRRIILRRGEIQIITGSDIEAETARPFWVETTAGRVRPIGTQFTLRQFERAVAVQVAQGAVELSPTEGRGIRLDAGSSVEFDRFGVSVVQPALQTNSSWTRGLLIAERQRLGDFVAELDRYHSGILRCDPAVADLVVSGVYPLKDTHSILRALEQVLPVRANTRLGYWTTLVAR